MWLGVQPYSGQPIPAPSTSMIATHRISVYETWPPTMVRVGLEIQLWSHCLCWDSTAKDALELDVA